jgi:hypothetical protein
MDDEVVVEETTGTEVPESTVEVEAAEASEQVGAVEPVEQAEDPAKKEKGVQKRFNELTAARHRAENEAEYWRKVAAGEIKPNQPQPEQQQGDFIPPGYPAEPALDGFDDYDQYNRALVRWEAGRLLAERDHVSEQTKAQAAQKATLSSHGARMEAAKERYADLDEVFAEAPQIAFNDSTFSAIVESDQSADIAYHLAKNPAEAARISALSPVKQIMEIARLEDRFKVSPAPVKRISQAPTPLNPIGGNGAVVQKDPDKMNDAEWLAYERARVGKLGRRY